MKVMATKPSDSRGVALVLVLLIVVLLYIIVAELVTKSSFDRFTAENQSVQIKIRHALRLALIQSLEELREDSENAGGEGGEGGALPPNAGAALPGAGQGAGGGEESEEPSDSMMDAWFRSKAIYNGDKIDVYVRIVDENRKFNILSLLSPDEDFATRSYQRLVRILDFLWSDTDEDLSRGDAEIWARKIDGLLKGEDRNEHRPKPPLKSDTEGHEQTIPFDIDDLQLIPDIPREVFDFRIVNNEFLHGLRSVLTVYTAISLDEGAQGASGSEAEATAPGSSEEASGSGGTEPGSEASSKDGSGGALLGPGIRLNINTVHPVVLRALEPDEEIPRSSIDALLEWRNEEDEEAIEEQEAQNAENLDNGLMDETGSGELPTKIFASLDDLDDVEEWMNLPQSKAKERLLGMLTTTSHVFTVHLAAVYKRNETGRAFSITRMRAVYVRMDGDEEVTFVPLVPLHFVEGMSIHLPDFPEEVDLYESAAEDGDPFAQEEGAWNPFLPDFYNPRKREESMGGWR